MKLTLYRMATSLGGPFIRYYLNKRLKAGKEDAERFSERLGTPSLPRPKGKLLWIHAASVGESLSVLPLIERFEKDQANWQILITTGTVTSAKLMESRLPKNARHQYVPVDRVAYVRPFLEHWKPDLALWMESEFWPNLVIESRARAIPMVLVNGRMSNRSYEKWTKSRAMIQRILASFRLILAQSETDGERFKDLGAKAVDTPGNLKFACDPLPANTDDLDKLSQHIGDRPVWLASSTHAGEEAICGRLQAKLKTEIKGLLTIIVPRHPARGIEVAAELAAQDLNVCLRSQNQDITPQTDVYIADTMGELGLFYRLCPVVYIGKTLVKGGGQNPIEPAQLKCALIFGPDMTNFTAIAEKLTAGQGAVTIQNEDDLGSTIHMLLTDKKTQTKMAKSAEKIATSEAHVLDRILDKLSPFLNDLDTK